MKERYLDLRFINLSNQRGFALLEQVFVMASVLFLICGITDLCRMAYTLSALSEAAQETVRELATTRGSGRSMPVDTRAPTVKWKRYTGNSSMGPATETESDSACAGLGENESCEPFVDTDALDIRAEGAPEASYHLDAALNQAGLQELQSALPRAKLGCNGSDCLNATYKIVADDQLTGAVEVKLQYQLPLFILFKSKPITLTRTVRRRLESDFVDRRIFHSNLRTEDIYTDQKK